MLKKILVVTLASVLVNIAGLSSASAVTREETEAQFSKRVKESIVKLGTGADARVEVKLRDKTRLKGYISEAGETAFVIVDAKTGTQVTVAYPQITQVKGNNLSTGATTAIGIGVLVGLGILLVYMFSGWSGW